MVVGHVLAESAKFFERFFDDELPRNQNAFATTHFGELISHFECISG
jgi:hypothetical protein